ncbi:MAG TPA: tyrosine-type recombinase/integrase [Hyphomicrobiaceae bacterium]|jgi:integrase
MSIYRTTVGTWGFRFLYMGELYKRQGFESKRAAQAAESTRRLEVDARGHRGTGWTGTPALAEWAGLWFQRIAPHMAPNTLQAYRQNFTHHLLPYLGAIPLEHLTRSRIRDRLLECRVRSQLAPGTVLAIRTALSACLTDAVEAGHLAVNPCQKMGRGQRRRGEATPTTTTEEVAHPMDEAERDRFLAAADRRPHWTAYMWIQAKAGARPAETLALRLEDIDWAAGTARLWQQWTGRRLRPLKTYEARTVDLTPGVLERLEAYVATLPPRLRAAGWLFAGTNNPSLPRNGSMPRKTFMALQREAGLSGFRLYDLRHTFASLLLSRNTPALYVSKQLGHKSLLTTLRVYAHWIPDTDSRKWVEQDGTRKIVPLVDHRNSEKTA